jgi:uncharacterized Rmd1/YagE family protein
MIQQRNKRPSLLSAPSPTQQKPLLARKPSVSGLKPSPGAVKNQRTSKTSQKLVVLPSAPQTKPLPEENDHGYETDAGIIKERKNEGERMGKEQRKRAGFNRLTAYCVAESFNMKLLASFLRREHNVVPRVFDNAFYTVSRPFALRAWALMNIRLDVPSTASSRLQSPHKSAIFRIRNLFRRNRPYVSTVRSGGVGLSRDLFHIRVR